MSADQLQFIFSLFSFVGVIGILFYIILTKAKQEEQVERVEILKEKLLRLQEYIIEVESQVEVQKEPEEETLKEKIVNLYDEGKNLSNIEEILSVPRAKIEMVLKFHNLKKSDNWRDSVDKLL